MFDNDMVKNYRREDATQTIDGLAGESRIAFLKQVYLKALGGLVLAAIAGIAMSMAIFNVPLLRTQPAQLVIIFGSFIFAQWVCAGLVQKKSTAVLGFVMGNIAEGIALGYILAVAMIVSQAKFGAPHMLIGQALGLTVMIVVALTGYVWTNPSEFRWANAILSAFFVPMLILMVLSFVFPIGGTLGLALSGVFVFISVISLLVTTKNVLRHLEPDQTWEGAFALSLSILILFWNILSLLIRLAASDD